MAIQIGLIFSYGISLKDWKKVGIQNRELAPYQKLKEQGVETTLLPYGNESDNQSSSEFKVSPLGRFGFFHDYRSLKLDLIKTNQMWGAWLGVWFKLVYRKPLYVRIGYEHYQFQCHRKAAFYKRWVGYLNSLISYHAADLISVTSFDQKDFIIKTFGISENKIRVHFNYIDTELFAPNKNLPKREGVLFVGRLNEQKNLFALIEGCKLADQKLYLIGEGELRNQLENHAKGLKADIEFLGRIPNQDLPHYLNSFSIFALPSFYEGNPKTFLEAISCGACCLVANSPGIKEIVSHKENAYLVETNANSIAEGLKVLAQDEKLRQEMGEKARNFALANCTLDSLVRFEAQIYKDLLGPRS